MDSRPPRDKLMGSNGGARAPGRLALLVVFAIGLCFGPTAGAQPTGDPALPEGALIWSPGDIVGGQWTVQSVSRHPEYVRYTLDGPDGRASLEVARSQGAADPWSSTHYRVQPSPGGGVPDPLLRGALEELRTWEARPDHQPFVGRAFDVSDGHVSPELAAQRPGGRSRIPDLLLPLLLLMGLLLTGGCLWVGVRERPDDRLAVLVAFPLALGAAVGSWWVMGPGSIPISWITILHEGSADRVVRALWGEGNHGPVFSALTQALTPGDVLPIRGVVALNIALHVGNTIGFLLVGRLLARGWLPGVLAAAWFALAPMMLNTALSELPTQLLTSELLLALGGLYALRANSRLAVATLVVLALLAVGTRLEAALPIAVVAGGMIVVQVWRRLERPAARWAVVVGLGVVAAGGVLGALGMVDDPALNRGTPGVPYVLAALVPTDPSPALLPVLLGATLPVGGVLLGLWGWLDALRRGPMWALLAVALWMLFRMYFTAAHRGEAPYELMRYGSMMFPIWVLLGVRGWVAFEDWLGARGLEGRRRLLAVGLVLGIQLVLVPDVALKALVPEHHRQVPSLYDVPLQRDQQEEARLLMGLIEEHPDCVIATTGARDPRLGRSISGWDHVLFGRSIEEPITLPRDPQKLQQRMATLGGPDACRIFYRGLDCAIVDGIHCDEEVGGRLPTGQRDLAGRPYYDHVTRTPSVEVAVYPLGR